MASSRPFWSTTGTGLTTTPATIYLPSGWSDLKVLVSAQCLGQTGNTYVAPAVTNVSGVITISEAGTPTGGTFAIKVFPVPKAGGYENPGTGAVAVTTALAYNASAATIKSALIATGYFVTGDTTAAGGALPTDVTLTLAGAYVGGLPILDFDSSLLTGGSNSRVYGRITTNPLGNGGYGYLEANAQEVWNSDMGGNKLDRFLYLAAVTGTASYWITAYR